jgi:signal transduction histidine kinase
LVDASATGKRSLRQTIAARSALAPNAIVTARAPSEEVDERVWARWLLIALLSLGGVLAAIALGLVQNRRLAQPLERLARTSRKLGAGDFSARAGRFAIPEIDAVAAALDASALNIARLVGREREFTANVSHQLRTPLTALHLRLEELRQLDDPALIRIEADRAIAEADRLERTITDLLSAARSELAQGAGDPLDLHALIESHTSTWRPLFERAGRRLEIGLSHAPRAHASAGAVGQALDVLLDNALQHGAGRVVLRVREHEGRPTITVEDAGDGIAPGHEAVIFEPGHSPRGSSGVGLHLARSLINSAGGQLELRSPRPPAFEIRLRPSRA